MRSRSRAPDYGPSASRPINLRTEGPADLVDAARSFVEASLSPLANFGVRAKDICTPHVGAVVQELLGEKAEEQLMRQEELHKNLRRLGSRGAARIERSVERKRARNLCLRMAARLDPPSASRVRGRGRPGHESERKLLFAIASVWFDLTGSWLTRSGESETPSLLFAREVYRMAGLEPPRSRWRAYDDVSRRGPKFSKG